MKVFLNLFVFTFRIENICLFLKSYLSQSLRVGNDSERWQWSHKTPQNDNSPPHGKPSADLGGLPKQKILLLHEVNSSLFVLDPLFLHCESFFLLLLRYFNNTHKKFHNQKFHNLLDFQKSTPNVTALVLWAQFSSHCLLLLA